MRLIPNPDLLLKDQFPRSSAIGIVEERDRTRFPFHPFAKDEWYDFMLKDFLKRTKREIGFFRKKNTPEEIELQQCFRQQFPEGLLLTTFNLNDHLRRRRVAMEVIEYWQKCFDPALTPQEQVAELLSEPPEYLCYGNVRKAVS